MCAAAPSWWTSSSSRSRPVIWAQTDAAVLAAMNIADQFLKEQQASDDLRRQVKENLEDANRLKLELSEAKREIFKLSTHK